MILGGSIVVKAYACYSKSESLLQQSSSGAFFSVIANYVIDNQGIVYGVALDEDCYSAQYMRAESKNDLIRLRGSKYLQAKMRNTYINVKKDLQENKLVLFTGTGCQINGLKKYLMSDYENLICVDVLCHGAASPQIWKKYIKWLEESKENKIINVNFRCKEKSWKEFGIAEIDSQSQKIYSTKDNDPYMKLFLENYSLRPSCFECTAKHYKMADISMADFWKIEDVAPEMENEMGVSLVLCRTEKGEKIFQNILNEIEYQEVSYQEAIKGNPVEYKSVDRPVMREEFFKDAKNMEFGKLIKKYPVVSLKRRIKNIILRTPMKILIGGGVNKSKNDNYGLLFTFRNDNL